MEQEKIQACSFFFSPIDFILFLWIYIEGKSSHRRCRHIHRYFELQSHNEFREITQKRTKHILHNNQLISHLSFYSFIYIFFFFTYLALVSINFLSSGSTQTWQHGLELDNCVRLFFFFPFHYLKYLRWTFLHFTESQLFYRNHR